MSLRQDVASSRSPPVPAHNRSLRTRRVLRGWLIAIVVAAGVVALFQMVILRPKPVPVRVLAVEPGRVEETVVSTRAGTIRARSTADLSVDVSGTITALHAREGDAVKKGDPLLSIDSRDAQTALEEARGQLEVLRALQREAEARELNTERDRERLTELLRSDSVSRSELDRAETEAVVAKAARAAAAARVSAQEKIVRRAELALSKCELEAPFDGVISDRHVEVGEWATPGKVVMHLINADFLYVRAELDEVDIAGLSIGLPARMTLDTYKGRAIPGRLTRLSPRVTTVQEENRTLEVDVTFEAVPPDIVLRPGMSADVEIILRAKESVPRIPMRALLSGNRVLMAHPDGHARETRLRIGLRNWEYAEVLDGIAIGDRVIVSLDSAELADGVPIRIETGGEP